MKALARHLRVLDMLHALFSSGPTDPGAPEQMVQRTRIAIREGDVDLAEALLGECGDAADADTDCLNLKGVIAEMRGDWRAARQYWVRAAKGTPQSAAAKHNLRRYYELFEFGRCRDWVAFGDEPEFVLTRREGWL